MEREYKNLRIDNIDFWSPDEVSGGGMRIYWSGNIGFGTLDIVKGVAIDFKLYARTEYMGKQFASKILNLLVDKIEIAD